MSKDLTGKQKRFVAAYAEGSSGKDAVIQAGYNVTSDKSAASLATTMLNNEKIQNALNESLKVRYPNAANLAADRLMSVLLNDESRPADVIKVVELLSKVCGWQAPSKHASVNVTLREKFKLPEE